MFGLGTTELIIILVILVMVFGLGKLPKAAGQIGNAVGTFRDALQGKDDEIEIEGEPVDEEPAKLENQKTDEAVRDASVTPQNRERTESVNGGSL